MASLATDNQAAGSTAFTASPLFNLPVELRFMIWRNLLYTDVYLDGTGKVFNKFESYHRSTTTFFRTCKQIHREGSTILYGENTFRVVCGSEAEDDHFYPPGRYAAVGLHRTYYERYTMPPLMVHPYVHLIKRFRITIKDFWPVDRKFDFAKRVVETLQKRGRLAYVGLEAPDWQPSGVLNSNKDPEVLRFFAGLCDVGKVEIYGAHIAEEVKENLIRKMTASYRERRKTTMVEDAVRAFETLDLAHFRDSSRAKKLMEDARHEAENNWWRFFKEARQKVVEELDVLEDYVKDLFFVYDRFIE